MPASHAPIRVHERIDSIPNVVLDACICAVFCYSRAYDVLRENRRVGGRIAYDGELSARVG